MTTRKQRGIWLSVISLLAVGFGPLTIKEGSTACSATKWLEQAAVHSDGQSVLPSAAMPENSCPACHQSFRQPCVEHFYG